MLNESVVAAIKSEVQRFRYHKGYTDELRKEFALAFKHCAATAAVAHAIGERLMISCKYYPVPQQVYEALDAISASMVPEFTGLERTREDSPQGSLADGLTEADVVRWRSMAEHGKTKAARDIASAILKRHEELQRTSRGMTAKAKA